MLEDKKKFVTVFDKNCKEYAVILETLASNDEKLRGIKREAKEFDKDSSIVSDENVITIGKKASKYYSQNFKDNYNEYGIHIGYKGARAWISCELFLMGKKTRENFINKYNSLRDQFDMDRHNHRENIMTIVKRDLLLPPYPMSHYNYFRKKLKDLQYRYAIAIFFRDYIFDFLKIKEENDKEHKEKQNF